MEVDARLTPGSNGHDDGDDTENQCVSELVSALRTASRAEDFVRVEEALAARETKLKREIEKQRQEKAVLEEKHEFEPPEKLRAEDDLMDSTAGRALMKIEDEGRDAAAVEGKEVIFLLPWKNEELENRISRSEKGSKKLRKGLRGNTQRRRSERLASVVSVADNSCIVSSAAPVKGNKGYRREIKNQIKRKKMGKKGRGEEYVQFRCNMLSFFNTMQRVKNHLTEAHLELLQQTPFWPLISAFYNSVISEDQCKKSESDVLNIIKCYNSRTMCFEFGSASASLTAEDIAEILGLPQDGEEIKLKGSRKYKSDFITRYFEVERVTKTMVDAGLEEAIKGERETDVEDVVRLIVIELCITFLLCNSVQVTSWNLVKCCEDLEKISRYSWAKAVADLLHRSLIKKTTRLKPYSVPGCVVVIMLWLCEKTNLIQPIEGREGHTPALVKWSLQELHLKLRQIDVEGIGLSFKEGKEMKKKKEIQSENTETKLLPTPTTSKGLDIENENLEKRSDDLWDMIQNASEEVAKAQGKVNRLTKKLESKKERIKCFKRKLKEEKEEKRKLKEDNEMLIAEKKSLFDTVKRLVKKLEGTLEAEREEGKSLKKEKKELMEENQELKDQLSRRSPCNAIQLRGDIQIEVSAEQSCSTRVEKSITKRPLDPEFESEQGGEKKRRVVEEETK